MLTLLISSPLTVFNIFVNTKEYPCLRCRTIAMSFNLLTDLLSKEQPATRRRKKLSAQEGFMRQSRTYTSK